MHTQYQRNTLSWPSTVKTRKPDGELTAQIPTSAHYSAVTGQNQPSESLTAGESPHYIPFDKVCTIITWYWNSCFGLVTELLFLSLSNSDSQKQHCRFMSEIVKQTGTWNRIRFQYTRPMLFTFYHLVSRNCDNAQKKDTCRGRVSNRKLLSLFFSFAINRDARVIFTRVLSIGYNHINAQSRCK